MSRPVGPKIGFSAQQTSTPIAISNEFAISVFASSHGGPASTFSSAVQVWRGSFIFPKPHDFDSPEKFLTAQHQARKSNLDKAGGQKVLMLSHCWRSPSTQITKRKLISTLGLNGWSYWADFLDLQATGPVPWRKEIEDGIRYCAKVVLFVDREYLLSFNCLQEVAFAAEFGKPIVVMVLEQQAMELLTKPSGAEAAWQELKAFEGKPLTPGVGGGNLLTQSKVAELFEMIASINVCMCRDLDFHNDSDRVVLQRMHDFVSAELAYQKEHALLQSKALEWERSQRDPSRLLRGAAVHEYEVWIKHAQERGSIPPPTDLQQQYVGQGKRRATGHRRMLQVLVAVTFLVVCALAIGAGVSWSQAASAKELAEANLQQAQASEELAKANEQRATKAEDEAYQRLWEVNDSMTREAAARAAAEQMAVVATMRQYLFLAIGDDFLNGHGQAAAREAVLLAEAVEDLDTRVEVMEAASALGRELHEFLHVIRRRRAAQFASSNECTPVGHVSADGRWVACDSLYARQFVVVDLESGAVLQAAYPFPLEALDVAWQGLTVTVVGCNSLDRRCNVMRAALPGQSASTTGVSAFQWEEVLVWNQSAVELAAEFVVVTAQFRSDGAELLIVLQAAAAWHLVTVVVADAAHSLVHSEIPGCPIENCTLLIKHQSQHLVENHHNGSIRIWDISTPESSSFRWLHAMQDRRLCGVGVAPGGRQVAVVTCDANTVTTFLDDKAQLLAGLEGGMRFGDDRRDVVIWNSDGTRFAVYTRDAQETMFHVIDVKEPALSKAAVGSRFDVVWCPVREQMLLFVHHRLGHMEVVSYDLEGADPLFFAQDEAQLVSVQWSHLGDRFVTVNSLGAMRMWYPNGSSYVLPHLGTGEVSWSSDDEWLAIAKTDMDEWGEGVLLINNKNGNTRLLDNGIECAQLMTRFSHTSDHIASVCITRWVADLAPPPVRAGMWGLADGAFREFDLENITIPSHGPRWTASGAFFVLPGLHSSGSAFVAIVRVSDGLVQYHAATDRFVLAAPSPDFEKVFVAGEEDVGLLKPGADGEWSFEKVASTAGSARVTSVAWALGSGRLFTAMADASVREWDVTLVDKQRCATSWQLCPAIAGYVPQAGMSVRPRVEGEDGLQILVVDGNGFRRLRNTAGYVEAIRRQAAGVSRTELDAFYGINSTRQEAEDVCWEVAGVG